MTTAEKKERFELCLELYGRMIKNDMYQTSNTGVKTLIEHGKLMLQAAATKTNKRSTSP